MNQELTRALNKAKVGIMTKKNSVFISTILFSLKFSWDESIPTACTDGLRLLINPSFFNNMSAEARIGLLAHESWHVAFQHMLRVGDRDFGIWNQAADHVINLMLLDKGYSLPEGGLHDPQFKGMSSEQVYDLLIQNKQDQQPNFQTDFEAPSDGSESGQGQGTSGTGAAEVEQKVTDILVKAATQSRMQNDDPGTIPGDIQRMLDELLNPKLPWNQILQNHMSALCKDDYSFRKPNRRFFPEHYLPSQHSEGLEEIAIAIDTSGSVSDEMFTEFLSEIDHIQKRLHPEKITIIDFDTSIKAVHTLTEDDDVTGVKFTGYGGTIINEVIDWAATEKPNVMLIFTDGHFRQYPLNPDIPIIWVIYRNPGFTYPYGKVIEYPLDN